MLTLQVRSPLCFQALHAPASYPVPLHHLLTVLLDGRRPEIYVEYNDLMLGQSPRVRIFTKCRKVGKESYSTGVLCCFVFENARACTGVRGECSV